MEVKKKRMELTPPEEAASAAAMEAVLGNDDILREILLRLGFPTSLVRAAAVSKRWLRQASDPAFLRRFRARHPPRLLGFYSRGWGPGMRFIPLPNQDPELAAVIRFGRYKLGKDLTQVCDCRDGRLLVETYNPREPVEYNFAVHSPLHPGRGTAALPRHPASFYSDIVRTRPRARFRLLRKDSANSMPCTEVQLISNGPNGREVWVNVPDLLVGACLAGRTSGPIELPEKMIRPNCSLLAADKLYMICMKGHILGLDFQSLSLFCIKLPDGVETEHGKDIGLSSAEGSGFYLIYIKGFQVHVWRHDSSCSINGKWKLVDTICLREAFGDLADSSWYSQGAAVHVRVAAVGDNADFVLLRIHDKIFCMQTCCRTVEKIYEITPEHPLLAFDPGVYPFMMPWPPTFPVLNDEA